MGWRSVVISQRAKVSLSLNNIVVQTIDGIHTVPADDIDVMVIETLQAVVTSAAIVRMIENGAVVIMVDAQYQPIVQCQSLTTSSCKASRLQQQILWPKERVAKAWTHIVHSKIENQIQVLKGLNADTSKLESQLAQLELNDVTNREAVAARYYFPAIFARAFSRADDDPVNAALNYGYAILLSVVNREIVTNGYLTQWGIHHINDANPFNLGSDLMEPFRPVIDQWVSATKMTDFTPEVKHLLVDLLNVGLTYNGKKEILRNAVSEYVNSILRFLSGETEQLSIEVVLPSEVSSRAINDYV